MTLTAFHRRRYPAVEALLLGGALWAGCTTPPGPPPAAFEVTHTIEVGAAPHGIRFSQDGDTAFVALSGDGQIAAIDLRRMTVVERWEAGTTPLDLVATDDGRWVVSQFRDSTLITPGPPTVIADVGAGPSLFTPEAARGRTYIVSEFADRLTALDTATGTIAATYPTGRRPYPADVTPDGVLAFVPNLTDGTVSVIDLLAGQTLAAPAVCEAPPGGALTRDGVAYVVACGGSDALAYVNTASFDVTARVTDGLGPRPFSVAMTRDGRYGLVNNAGGETLSILDVAARRIVQHVSVGKQPIVVRMHPDGRRALVANEVSGTVSVLAVPEAPPPTAGARNEVIVLGMIHGRHRTSRRYSIDVLKNLIRAIDPDYVLTEIPPNRFDAARDGFEAADTIAEARVRRFPEYVDALFPLTKEMDFEIIPTAGWTQPMADFRSARLQAISEDPDRAAEWATYERANARADSALAAGGEPDDPRWIHTDAYDDAYQIRLGVYNALFNDELGPGGWDAINAAHYAHIARALDVHRGEGKRFLITYGAGHKGWFLRALRQRNDITLLEAGPFLDQVP